MEGTCLEPGILGGVNDLDEVWIADADGIGPDADGRAPLPVPVAKIGVNLASQREAGAVEVGEAGENGSGEVAEGGEGELVDDPGADEGHGREEEVGS